MLGDMCGWTRAREKETDRRRDREREREDAGVGIDPPDTEEKWRLHVTKILWWMIALVASGVPPILRWYFDGLIDVDTMTSLPEVRSPPYGPLWYRNDWQQHAEPPPTALMDDTVVHRWQRKHLEEDRGSRIRLCEIDFATGWIRTLDIKLCHYG